MEEARFFYYSNLAKYSITNNLILIILIIIEMYPILIDFMQSPFILRNFYNMTTNFKIIYKPLNNFDKLNIYKLFRDLRNENNLYPIYILIPMLSLVIIYIIFFIVFSILDKNIKNSGIVMKSSFGIYFKIFFVNLYDHIVFRTASIYLYDVLVSYLAISTNYIILIITIIMFTLTLYLNIEYFNTFRLSIKYDLNYKYVYDGKFMLYADYFSLMLKLSICFSHNVDYDTFLAFFNIVKFIITICAFLKFITSNCFNLVNCSKGMIFIYCLLLFILNFIFSSITKNNGLYYIYIVLSFLCSIVLTFYLRYMKMIKVIRAPIIPENNLLTQEKFELLCEYYQHSNFNYLLNQICFAIKIKTFDEKVPLIQSNSNIKSIKNGVKNLRDNNLLLHLFLTFISNKFKEDSENPLLDKDVNLFYYIICKIYLELMTNQQNNFYLLFETRRILLRLRKINLVLYYDLKFFYELLCQEYSHQNNVNFLIYNDAFYKTYDSIQNFIFEYRNFIAKRNYCKTKNFIKIANLVCEYKEKITKNYEILSTSPYKDEYQRIIFRVIFEGLFNIGINKDPTSILLINEEFTIYEEMLDKQYHSEQYLKIMIDLKKMGTKIIKIGRDLNFLWDQNIDSMFPSQFNHIAKKNFYYDYETQEKNIGSQMFRFFIWDNTQNLKQFIYLYKIYPKIKNDIAFLDGYYQLGNEPLLITEKDFSSNQENIILTSKALQSLLYINQDFINILEKFQCFINLNSFIHYKQNYTFHIKTYVKYLNTLSDKLINMCSKEELSIIESLINDIKQLETANLNNKTYQFINLFSLTSEDLNFLKEYKIYTLKQVKDKKLVKEVSTTRFEWEQEENFNLFSTQNMISSVINGFDTNSLISVPNVLDGLTLAGLSNKRKNNIHKNQNNNNLVIIIFNLFVIIVAILGLIYENSLNNILLNKISFYKAVYSFNTLILNTMVSYYSMICFVKDKGKECVNEMKSYLTEIEFSEIYDLLEYEQNLKITNLSDRFKTLKKEVEKSKDNEIEIFLTSKKNEIHLFFDNNSLYYSIASKQNFEYLMGSFINKLIITTNSDDFQTVDIYPILVDDNFYPIHLYNSHNLIKLKSTQIYIYEIMISYLDYSNHFYDLQEVIEKKANEQITSNKVTLIIFIVALIFSNLLIMGICFYFFKNFKKLANSKLQFMEILLKNQENIEIINKKLQIISVLFKLYKQHPIKLLKKLSEKMKNQTSKKEHNNVNNQKKLEEDYEIQKIKEKIHDFSFIINPFIVILSILVIFYIIYSILFLIISNMSFTELYNVCKIIESSSYSVLQFFIELGIIQLYKFVKIPETALYNTLWAIYHNKTKDDGENAFVDLLNIIQDTMQKEKSLKELKTEIGNSNNIITLDCLTLYSSIKDERLEIIFKEHKEIDYEQILINYCNSIPTLKYQTEELFIEDLAYSMMKLIVVNYKNKNYIPDYTPSELMSVTIKSLEIYRPLKIFLGDYYFSYLDYETKNHFYILLGFLLGNIILEIVYFLIIKIRIIDKIEIINKNLDKLLIMLKCVN